MPGLRRLGAACLLKAANLPRYSSSGSTVLFPASCRAKCSASCFLVNILAFDLSPTKTGAAPPNARISINRSNHDTAILPPGSFIVLLIIHFILKAFATDAP